MRQKKKKKVLLVFMFLTEYILSSSTSYLMNACVLTHDCYYGIKSDEQTGSPQQCIFSLQLSEALCWRQLVQWLVLRPRGEGAHQITDSPHRLELPCGGGVDGPCDSWSPVDIQWFLCHSCCQPRHLTWFCAARNVVRVGGAYEGRSHVLYASSRLQLEQQRITKTIDRMGQIDRSPQLLNWWSGSCIETQLRPMIVRCL